MKSTAVRELRRHPMMIEKPFDDETPETVIMDPVSGFALNIPVSMVGWPNWWNERPDIYARIRQLRKDMGIEIVDFPNGVSQPPPPKEKEVWIDSGTGEVYG